MGLVAANNTWGSQGSQLDPLRSDLFRVNITLPPAVAGGGANLWDAEISFAVEKFPFPERSREMIGIKYLQQTNFVPGGDTPTPAINLSIRWAFNRRTAELLEIWNQFSANSTNGGVGIASLVKTNGLVVHLIPDMGALTNPQDATSGSAGAALVDGPAWYLEGIQLKSLKPAPDLDMTQGNQLLGLELGLQIDRYYAVNNDPSNLSVLNLT